MGLPSHYKYSDFNWYTILENLAMKRIIFKSIPIIGLFFVFTLSTCNQEEIVPREFPRLETLEVTEIDSEGATFNARIISQGNQEISEYGFVWGESAQIDIERGEWKKIIGKPNSDTFSLRISSTLEKNKKYYVKAYTKTKDYKTYGSIPSFVSLGSEAPIIESFSPSNANIGDTIYVLGKNFSTLEYTTSAFIGGVKSRVISTNYDTIQIIVPDTINAKESVLSISFAGNISKANSLFTINPPEIEVFSPTEAINNTLITIKGKNFGYGPAKVFFGEHEATVTNVSNGEITVLFPTGIEPEEYDVKIELFGYSTVSINKIYNKSLYISDFNPKSGSWGTEIEIKVENFNKNSASIVEFDTYQGDIISTTDSTVTVTFPDIERSYLSTIKLFSENQSVETIEYFSLDTTKIYSIEPKIGTVGDTLKIIGENFHPNLQYNKVSFANQKYTNLENVKGNRNELYVVIPDDETSDLLKISILGRNIISQEKFEYTRPILHSVSPEIVSYSTIVDLRGENFSKVQYGNEIIIDGYPFYAAQLLYTSDTLIKFSISRDFGKPESTIKIKTGPYLSLSEETIKFVWNRIRSVFNRNYPAAFMIGDELYYGFGNDMGGNYNQLYKINLNTNQSTYLTYIKNGIYEFGVGGISFANNNFGFHGLGRKYNSSISSYFYSQKLFRYNPATYNWEHYTSSPYPETYLQSFFQLGEYTYIGLGEGENRKTKEFWKYHPDNNTWEQIASLPGESRNDAVSISDGSYGYVGFGKNESGELLNDFYKYDPSTDSWTRLNTSGLPNMAGYTPVYDDPYIYLAGGENDAEKYTVFRYNTTTDSWEELSNFATNHTSRGLGYIRDDKIYIFSRGIFYRYNQENESSIIPLK